MDDQHSGTSEVGRNYIGCTVNPKFHICARLSPDKVIINSYAAKSCIVTSYKRKWHKRQHNQENRWRLQQIPNHAEIPNPLPDDRIFLKLPFLEEYNEDSSTWGYDKITCNSTVIWHATNLNNQVILNCMYC